MIKKYKSYANKQMLEVIMWPDLTLDGGAKGIVLEVTLDDLVDIHSIQKLY
jgi:hypothetical protein